MSCSSGGIRNVMLTWPVQARYLSDDPLSLSRQRVRRAKPRITRYLKPDLWQKVKAFIESTQRDKHHSLNPELTAP